MLKVLVRRAPLAACLTLSLLSVEAGAQQVDPNLGRNLAATCANCHGTNGKAVGEGKKIAGLPAVALVTLLTEYKKGSLDGQLTIMHQIAKGYTDEQIRAIADYLATQGR